MIIRQRDKKPIAWLLTVAMLFLVLVAPGGMVMANPLGNGELAHNQSMNQSESACQMDMDMDMAMDADSMECDSCADSSCASNCHSCVQAQFMALIHDLLFKQETERYLENATPRLTPLGHTPIPRPPRQLLS